MTDIHVLGIRHHGPGSARSVSEALDELRPQVVLVEGPPEFDDIVEILADAETEPPIAGLVYAVDEPRQASFYPLASFSPEWVALRWALRNGATALSIDLPAVHRTAIAKALRARAEEREAALVEAAEREVATGGASGDDEPGDEQRDVATSGEADTDTEGDGTANGTRPDDESGAAPDPATSDGVRVDGATPEPEPAADPADDELDAQEAARYVAEDPITALAAAAGYDDPERWWEDAVEHRTDSVLDRFEAIAEGVAELRRDRERPESALTPDGTLDLDALENPLGELMTELREASMRKRLREVIKEGHERVVVVCGAWHAPALDPASFPPAARDNRVLRGLPKTKVAAAWTPWTSSRLSYRSGYGAGVASPGWYRHLFEHWASGTDRDVETTWLVRVARELREQGVDASTASVVEAARLATALAALRGRPSAGLSELDDAALSVLVNGDPLPLSLVHEELVVGRELGTVPESAPLVPLAADLAAQQKSTRLKPSASTQKIVLDLRTDAGLRRSVLLHRLRLLGIGWGVVVDAGRTGGTFKEAWELSWEPELAVALVEASVHGTTVLGAAEARAAERAREAGSLQALSELLERCLLAEIPVHDTVQELARRAAVQSDVSELLAAIEPLARVQRYGTVRGAASDEVRAILDATAVRAFVGLPGAATGIDDDAALRLRRTMESAHRGLSLIDEAELSAGWWQALGIVADRDTIPGLVVGRAVRMLLDAGELDRGVVATRMSRRLSIAADPCDAAGWLDGFLAGDALVLVHDPQLLAIVDAWLAGAREETFDDLLPLLRRTFAAFEKPERALIGRQVSHIGTRAPAMPSGEASEAVVVVDLAQAAPGISAVARLTGWEVVA
ncbi:hypothetical protein F8O01_14665 [Pseudoclavibacter chungangensis]|uniref:Uncharacterized protein n=1 Tax=Pseudoclavibacter chungangensis TaxID=587635 RepID=A0A7J5BNN4_9MICO|nr:DUF5682 family protein [Pseudoclavibacter chungangensis]KAB1653861.1 hypothetical protein F8O01_14665 [Pseudoclavibacter chungangensis]NYJ68124.1 hypothetical protein [Pseudoclavibacter chungangensis]